MPDPTPEPRTLRLLVEYDGRRFAGFQKQPGKRTVQGVLDAAILQITGEAVTSYGAGRTDSGVHATGQVVSFTLANPISLPQLQRGLNALAGPELAVQRIQEVPADFHARYAAHWRQYRYRLLLGPAPSALRRHVVLWPGREPLDTGAMGRVWASLEGDHDFSPWQNAGAEVDHSRCRVHLATFTPAEDEWHFVLRADRFLYRMVRNLVGSALRVGLGRLSEAAFAEMLASGAGRGGPAVSARGLYLEAVAYDLPWGTAADDPVDGEVNLP